MSAVPGGTAFVFPGQGSQYPGMGRDLRWCGAAALSRVDTAEEVTGLPVGELMTRADAATIADPEIAQLLVLVHSAVLLHQARSDGASCAVVAGHSLGEYTAMLAAGMLRWPDALTLVAARGRAMAAAARRAPGAMAAVVGLDPARVQDLCAAARAQPVVVANVNSPRQAVVSGTVEGVDQVVTAATAGGALRARRLPVGGAYHSPLMDPAQAELAPLLCAVPLADPALPLVSSLTGAAVRTAAEHRRALSGQITAPVRWRHAAELLAARGVGHYLEIGPGRVLAGLGREMHRAATHTGVHPARSARPPVPTPVEATS
jgi:[acyl-carrier-protein] S-malonyltransferase